MPHVPPQLAGHASLVPHMLPQLQPAPILGASRFLQKFGKKLSSVRNRVPASRRSRSTVYQFIYSLFFKLSDKVRQREKRL